MGRYVIRRLLWVGVIMFAITFFAFVVFYILPPTDPASAFAGRQANPEMIAEVREILGLDRPWYAQYGSFVADLVTGDEYGWPGFGFSFASRTPIKPELFERALVTLQLAVGAAVVWLLIGVPTGIVSALKRGKPVDRISMGFALFGVSAPVFWLALMSLYIFWYKLHWVPGTGYTRFTDNPVEWFTHLMMPWVVLALLFSAVYARMTRANLLEVMSEDYIRTARAKGLTERRVIGRHALRASLTPIVTLFGLDFGSLLGGAIVTEHVFNIPGLGNYTIDAVGRGDLPRVLAVVVFASIGITLMNLIVDLLYAYLDPRVRYS